jgi:hypothetical protein
MQGPSRALPRRAGGTWFATFAVLAECIGGLWTAEPTAPGFRKSAPVVARGRGSSSTLAASDQERSRTSSARAPLLRTACGVGGIPTRDK